ncbi:MAG: hypothetical protein ACTSWZ_03450 [Candidatus Heimdallarchaeaceae archaeon]
MIYEYLQKIKQLIDSLGVQPTYNTYTFTEILLINYLAGEKENPAVLLVDSTPGENKTRTIKQFAKIVKAKMTSILVSKETRRRDIIGEKLFEIQLDDRKKEITSELDKNSPITKSDILYLDESLNAPTPFWDLLRGIRNTGEIDLQSSGVIKTPIRLIIETNNIGERDNGSLSDLKLADLDRYSMYFKVESVIKEALNNGIEDRQSNNIFTRLFNRKFSEKIEELESEIDISKININNIEIPSYIEKSIFQVLAIIQKHSKGHIITSRKITQLKRYLQASAVVKMRDKVNKDDLYLLLNVYRVFSDLLDDNWESEVSSFIEMIEENTIEKIEQFREDPFNIDLTEEEFLRLDVEDLNDLQLVALQQKELSDGAVKIVRDELKKRLHVRNECKGGSITDVDIEVEVDDEVGEMLKKYREWTIEREGIAFNMRGYGKIIDGTKIRVLETFPNIEEITTQEDLEKYKRISKELTKIRIVSD